MKNDNPVVIVVMTFRYSNKEPNRRVFSIDEEVFKYMKCLESYIRKPQSSQLLNVYPHLRFYEEREQLELIEDSTFTEYEQDFNENK